MNVQMKMLMAMLTVGLVFSYANAAPNCCTSDQSKSKFEKDREAILAMAGEYEVQFQFMETVAIQPDYTVREAYFSDATEFVEVIEDNGDSIVLQHILVLNDPEDDSKSRVVKHWRQDWEYENRELFEFEGRNTWSPRTISEEEAKGTWTQRVFQVDDSPRYQGYGKWTHDAGVSAWESNETARPLPRREWSKRDDYDILMVTNRHTLTPTGWVHEQDNTKIILPDDGETVRGVEKPTAMVREVGLNVYDRIDDYDFSKGYEYWQDTQAFWQDVRNAWDVWFAKGETIHLADKVDDKPLWKHMFILAGEVREQGEYNSEEGQEKIQEVLASFREPAATSNEQASTQY